MLKDSNTFSRLERTLRHNGTLSLFEEEQGMIRRRLMITSQTVPEGLSDNPSAVAFEGSFDFSDTTLSIVLDTRTLSPLTDIWMTKQKDDALPPGEEDADTFLRVLLDALQDDYGFSLPVYAFLSDFGHYIICPGR